MIDLEQLRQLVAIADCQTISAAAESLHMSQPALSRAMQRLERELGASLFIRKKSRLSLNQTGELAVEHARVLLKDAETFMDQIRSHASRLSTISIGSSSPAPMWDLGAKLGVLFPEYTLAMEFKDEQTLIEGLNENRYQLIIVNDPPQSSNIISRPYTKERLSVEVPKTHPFALQGYATFADLERYPVLGIREPTIWWDLLQSYGVHLIFQDDPAVLRDLTRSSDLISMSSDLASQWLKPSQNRVIVPISDASAVSSFFLCTIPQNARLMDALCPEGE